MFCLIGVQRKTLGFLLLTLFSVVVTAAKFACVCSLACRVRGDAACLFCMLDADGIDAMA
jgi:hypothetical protein